MLFVKFGIHKTTSFDLHSASALGCSPMPTSALGNACSPEEIIKIWEKRNPLPILYIKQLIFPPFPPTMGRSGYYPMLSIPTFSLFIFNI